MSSDESEAPGEANMWQWLFELAYHHEIADTLLEVGGVRLLDDCSATCENVFDVNVYVEETCRFPRSSELPRAVTEDVGMPSRASVAAVARRWLGPSDLDDPFLCCGAHADEFLEHEGHVPGGADVLRRRLTEFVGGCARRRGGSSAVEL